MVTTFEGVDASPVPITLVAVTTNEYSLPLFNPRTTHVVAGATAVQVPPPGFADTVYPVIELPPSDAGGDQDT